MKQYIGTKIIEAQPALRNARGEIIPANVPVSLDELVEEGYKVRYADGYESFSPKAVFERAYLPLEVNGGLKTYAPSISAGMVERFIDHHETMTMGGKTTVVRAVLKNGFEIVESSSCVSAENYDEKMGEKICMKKIRDKIRMLLGFLLQTAVGGVNGEAAAENSCCDEDSAAAELPTVRLFVSQPMRGKTDEEIERERAELIETAKVMYGGRGTVEVIDSFFKGGLNIPDGTQAPLYHLGKSLELLATADAAIFGEDWEEARGCRIEHACADEYGITMLLPVKEG